jgi:hypothetical protein
VRKNTQNNEVLRLVPFRTPLDLQLCGRSEAIQSRIQLIQSEEISRPVLVSMATVVAYTHAQRFKQAHDMIGQTIKQNQSIAEIFVVRAHVRYTEGENCPEGEMVRGGLPHLPHPVELLFLSHTMVLAAMLS